jgi:hypothetical protein
MLVVDGSGLPLGFHLDGANRAHQDWSGQVRQRV